MRIAIIGGGISGMVAAWKLHHHHELTIFESNEYIGGHTHTVDVDDEIDGQQVNRGIDTGFIVYNNRTYPNFVKILETLGVETHPTEMSFSVQSDSTGWEYNGSSLSGLFAQHRQLLNPRFYQFVWEIFKFFRNAPAVLAEAEQDLTVGAYLQSEGYSTRFAENYLVPMGAAIWSCPPAIFAQFPIRFVVEFYQNHGLLAVRNRPQWRVISGGSREYVRKLTASFASRIRLNTPVQRVERTPGSVRVATEDSGWEEFDHLIFACHSDQALRLLTAPTSTESEILSSFPYQKNIALLHTDESILPQRRPAWASWNYHVPREPEAPATVTYLMNRLQGFSSQRQFCVTLNEESRIAPQSVLKKMVYHHPVFTLGRSEAKNRHAELLDYQRISYCGAYWGNGFHEDGVNSGLRVCEALELKETQSERSRTGETVCKVASIPAG